VLVQSAGWVTSEGVDHLLRVGYVLKMGVNFAGSGEVRTGEYILKGRVDYEGVGKL